MSDIKFKCSACSGHLAIEEAGAGMDVSCPHCGSSTQVPSRAQTCQRTTTGPDAPASVLADRTEIRRRPVRSSVPSGRLEENVAYTRFATERLAFVFLAVLAAAISNDHAAHVPNGDGLYLPWQQGATIWNVLTLALGFLLFGYAALTLLVRAPIWRQRCTADVRQASQDHYLEFSFALFLREFFVAGGIVIGTCMAWLAYITVASGGKVWQ